MDLHFTGTVLEWMWRRNESEGILDVTSAATLKEEWCLVSFLYRQALIKLSVYAAAAGKSPVSCVLSKKSQESKTEQE